MTTAGDEPTIEILADADAAADAAADRIAHSLADAVRERGRADWATTGGSAAVPLYLRLSATPLRDVVPWEGVHVWWGDDRMVPRDHPLSNRQPFDQVLLRATAYSGLSGTGDDAITPYPGQHVGVPLPEANIHAMPIDLALGRSTSTDEAAREAASTYESALRAAPLAHDADGFPILDVVLVGVGPDGHVLSVFPGSPLFDSKHWVSAVEAPTHVEPHMARVSLNPAILAAARLPIAVVLGEGKASIVADVLGGKRDVRSWPAQLARRSGAIWILDAASAADLESAPEPSR